MYTKIVNNAFWCAPHSNNHRLLTVFSGVHKKKSSTLLTMFAGVHRKKQHILLTVFSGVHRNKATLCSQCFLVCADKKATLCPQCFWCAQKKKATLVHNFPLGWMGLFWICLEGHVPNLWGWFGLGGFVSQKSKATLC